MFRRPPSVALSDVSLAVEPGERLAIVGESGAGKTTLARIGLGLIRPDAGTVSLFGEDTRQWSSTRWREARRGAQLLFQDPRAMLNPAMRLATLLEESAALHRPENDPRREAIGVLDAVGLEGKERAFPNELSGGEQRRAGIARLLLARPRLVVADEPTAGLDAALKASIIELLLERVGSECAVVIISHDLPLVTWACGRMIVMQGGTIVDAFATSDLSGNRHIYTRKLLISSGMGASLRGAR